MPNGTNVAFFGSPLADDTSELFTDLGLAGNDILEGDSGDDFLAGLDGIDQIKGIIAVYFLACQNLSPLNMTMLGGFIFVDRLLNKHKYLTTIRSKISLSL